MRRNIVKNALMGFLGLVAVIFVLYVFKQLFPQLVENFAGDAAGAEECSNEAPIKMCPQGKMCNPESKKCVNL